jgi:hypothetical protein
LRLDPRDLEAWRAYLRRAIEADPPHDPFDSREMILELDAVAARLALLFEGRRLPDDG